MQVALKYQLSTRKTKYQGWFFRRIKGWRKALNSILLQSCQQEKLLTSLGESILQYFINSECFSSEYQLAVESEQLNQGNFTSPNYILQNDNMKALNVCYQESKMHYLVKLLSWWTEGSRSISLTLNKDEIAC